MQLLVLSCVWLFVLLAQTQASYMGGGMTKYFTPADLGFGAGEIDLEDSDGSIAGAEEDLKLDGTNLDGARAAFESAKDTFQSEKNAFNRAKRCLRKPACDASTDLNDYKPIFMSTDAPCFKDLVATLQPSSDICGCVGAAEAAGMNSFTYSDGTCRLFPSLAVSDGGTDVEIYTQSVPLGNSAPTVKFTVNPGYSYLEMAEAKLTWELDDPCDNVAKMVVNLNSVLDDIDDETYDRTEILSADGTFVLEGANVCLADSVTFTLYNSDDDELLTTDWTNFRQYDELAGEQATVSIDSYKDSSYYCTFFAETKKTRDEAKKMCDQDDGNTIYDYGVNDEVLESMTLYGDVWMGINNPKDGDDYYEWEYNEKYVIAFDDPIWANPEDVADKNCAYLQNSDDTGKKEMVAADCDELHFVMCSF